VLELQFLDSEEREHLERLGLQILSENETLEKLDRSYYRVELRFANPEALLAFVDRDYSAHGVAGTEAVRASNGEADPCKLACHFAERAPANAFKEDVALAEAGQFEVSVPQPVSRRSRYRVLVQFSDQASIRQLQQELLRYQAGDKAKGALTNIQRHQLFDALERIAQVGPEERRGNRLRTEALPDGRFYVDVDLWHPGAISLVSEVIRQFREAVVALGGRVTDGPRSVAETLLLARVHVDAAGLEALLAYDRVAYADLPPRIEAPQFSIFDAGNMPADLPAVPADGPLACVVDSGVVAGHPLLHGVLVDERDFDSGDGTAVDTVGHGTHVAGIVVYGDIPQCLSAGWWEPRVRLLSAKVLRQGQQGEPEFADEKRAVTQLQEAITYFAREHDCRIFNLSIGDADRPYPGGRQLDWALVLDELARELDVVIIVSAGNVVSPGVPTPLVAREFQPKIRDMLLTPEHALIDPATAALALTVGAVAREDAPFRSANAPGERTYLVAAPPGCPSPFTRAGLIEELGNGLRRTVKPELVAFGGNYAFDTTTRQWRRSDPQLGEPSLKYDFATDRPLAAMCGTSAAAPHVTHCCAIVEAELRRAAPEGQRPSANLIRALAVHAARHTNELEEWMCSGYSDAEGKRRLLRAAGYGMTEPERAAFSAENRVVLIAEDQVQEGCFHLYELELPDAFVASNDRRFIRVTLAYDPPVRATRLDYLSRTMWFRLYRGLSAESIMAAVAKLGDAGDPPKLPDANVVKSDPAYTKLQWSTVQSAVFRGSRPGAFDYRASADGPALFHILVGCASRFPADPQPLQRYALVASLEHSNATVRLYQIVRQRVEQRIRLQA